mgnify:CR=1 FL=1
MSQFIDIAGERFGRLVAISPVKAGEGVKWLCKCDCGGETITTASKLRSGHTKSCGCFQREQTSLATSKDYTGMKFGRLTVQKRISGRSTKYQCICDCGNIVIVLGSNLVSGATKSCGCFRSELVTKADTKHGGCKTRLYSIWRNMLDRCNNPKNKEYHRYGGRGIIVCAEWETDFSSFREWALSSGYQDNLTIDRIDNDLGYAPSNCQWLTRAENSTKIKKDKSKSATTKRPSGAAHRPW